MAWWTRLLHCYVITRRGGPVSAFIILQLTSFDFFLGTLPDHKVRKDGSGPGAGLRLSVAQGHFSRDTYWVLDPSLEGERWSLIMKWVNYNVIISITLACEWVDLQVQLYGNSVRYIKAGFEITARASTSHPVRSVFFRYTQLKYRGPRCLFSSLFFDCISTLRVLCCVKHGNIC